MEPNKSWAYRARHQEPLVEVMVVRLGTQKPARTLVRFVDAEFEGREEWVPPARMKVPWAQVDAFRAREARWETLRSLGPAEEALEYAAEHIFLEYIAEEVARGGYRDGTAIHVADVGTLAVSTGIEVSELTGHPASFVEDGVRMAPWPITEIVVQAVARRHAEQVLMFVEAEERQARHEAIHGRYSRGHQDFYITPEDSRQSDDEFGKPTRQLLRSWCGAEETERFDELVELRREIKRVGDVAERAIELLRAAGSGDQAAQLSRELGTPVEMLRIDDATDRS
ncbi:hypothetical protein ACHAAC_17430 [Aeromicrobium sp. CF4.19]|uniref:hypothetical protein n=1 Tax=Aeromicrobium sp. CF4.19 TaxID=3373082 RepID=UPI003EE504F3